MSSHRKVIYYIAISLDGFIAREDGSFDGFLTEGQHIAEYAESLQAFDTVLMGRYTYEVGYQYGLEPGEPSPTYPHMRQYVFSSSMAQSTHEQLEVINTDATEFVQALKQQTGGSIYLCGGGKLAGSLLQANLIDEVILKVNPVVFGQGISLFEGESHVADLSLLDSKVYNNGVHFNRYALLST